MSWFACPPTPQCCCRSAFTEAGGHNTIPLEVARLRVAADAIYMLLRLLVPPPKALCCRCCPLEICGDDVKRRSPDAFFHGQDMPSTRPTASTNLAFRASPALLPLLTAVGGAGRCVCPHPRLLLRGHVHVAGSRGGRRVQSDVDAHFPGAGRVDQPSRGGCGSALLTGSRFLAPTMEVRAFFC